MIEETIDWLLTKLPSYVALGMVDDAERIFGRNSNWSSAKVLISENPKCKLEMISFISEEFTDIMQVLAVQAALFKSLEYGYFSITSQIRYEKAAVLRFATVPSSSSHCVTGRIISGGPNYDSLAQRWTLEGKPKLLNGDFAELFGKI